jgi:hypothetical protein
MTVAKDWIKTCIASHPICSGSSDVIPWFPTRLLYIGQSPAKVRVVHTAGHILRSDEKYVTLSHCWGKGQPLRLQKHNKMTLLSGFPVQSLPQTFQHAIIVTRSLQIDYIWIDSLCIIQDEPDDWLHESSLMHKVYANSLCNIAATAARDSSEGLFFTRDVWKLQPGRIEILIKKDLNLLYEIHDASTWEHSVSNAPLNRRAWVIQERLLARKVLHFGKEQLAWECCELEATEFYPKGLPEGTAPFTRFKLLDPKINSPASLYQEKHPVNLWPYQKWQRVVEVYSDAGLTNASDKLVALSGLASHFKTVCNDEYVAGMWKRFLCSQLLWTVAAAVRAEKYRAPSFSWAALDGEVGPVEITESGIVAKILNISIDKLDDEMGPVRGGHLVLSGRVMSIHTKLKHVGRYTEVTFINDQDIGPLLDRPYHCSLLAGLDVATETFPQPSYILQIRRKTHPVDQQYIRCLVLAHIDGTQGDYVRMGHLYASEGWELDALEQSGGEEKIPCERYDAETGHHVIRLF